MRAADNPLFDEVLEELPARRMVDVDLEVTGLDREEVATRLSELLGTIDTDAVVRVRVVGRPVAAGVVSAAAVRTLAPSTMTVTLAPAARRPGRSGAS